MIDLHTHSTCSDGTCTPAELIALAEEAGLTAVALCDHNTVDGLPEFLAAAEGSPVEAVPGVEFSTGYEGKELHILGLFIPPEQYAAVTKFLDRLLEDKERSNRDLIRGLNAAGMELDYDALRRDHPDGVINRAVIAGEMVRKGYVSSVKEAFSQWLGEQHGYYHPPRRPGSPEVIRMIRSMGCVSVLAHSFLDLDEEGLRRFLAEAVPAGLDGMETRYPRFSAEQTRLAAGIAREFGLAESGGSDFHGTIKPDIRMGTGTGTLAVPDGFLPLLRERSRRGICENTQKKDSVMPGGVV